MRWIFWILGLFALAVAVALALRFNDGYALFVWPPYRVELSLNLLALTLGGLGSAVYGIAQKRSGIDLPMHLC